MKKTFNYIFSKFEIKDYVFMLLALTVIPTVAGAFKLTALSAISGVLLVLATVTVYKNYSLGYGVTLAALGLYCYYLMTNNLTGSILLTAGIIMPLLVYKIVALHVDKLNAVQKLNKWDYIVGGILVVLSAYPVYLLMISMNSYLAPVEATMVVLSIIMAFLIIRNYNFAKYFYIVISIMQLVIIILQMVDVDITRACVMCGLLLSTILQIIYFFKDLHLRAKAYRQSHPRTKSRKSKTKPADAEV